MASPRIAVVAQEPTGILNGKAAVAGYWSKVLELLPNLHFELISAFVGADSVAIHYQGVSGAAVEVFFFNQTGLVCKAAAHYL